MRRFSVILSMLMLMAAASACYSGELPADLTFSPDELPGALIGEMYEVTITVSESVTPIGDISIAEGDLPPGLEFVFEGGSDTALIRGTPEIEGAFHFSVSAWCFGTSIDGQTGEQEYVIVVE